MPDAKQWEIAMQKEYDSIMKNDTWTLIPRPKYAKVIKSRWVLQIEDANNLYKARFCAKGFTQRWGEDYDKTYARRQIYVHPHAPSTAHRRQRQHGSSNGRQHSIPQQNS